MEGNIQDQTIEVVKVAPRFVVVKDRLGEEHFVKSKSFTGHFPVIGCIYTCKSVRKLKNTNKIELSGVTLKKTVSITPINQIKNIDEEIKLKLNLIYYLVSNYIDIEIYNNIVSNLSILGYEVDKIRLLPCYNTEKTGLSNLYNIFAENTGNHKIQLKTNLDSFFKRKSGKSWEMIMEDINRIYLFDKKANLKEAKCFQEHIINLTDFSKTSSKIKIFIDEAWIINSNKGFICGLVWDGDSIDENLLPKRLTHADKPDKLEKDPKLLLNCKKALPFILSFDENNYSELFTKAVKFILGWLLPQSGSACEVTINAEYYSNNTGEYPINTDKTKEYQKLFKELQTKSKFRYQRWIIKEVKWVDKNYEYVPWGDLLGYIGKCDTEISKKYYNYHNFNKVYGITNISNDYLNALNKIDQEDFYAKNYIELIKISNTDAFTNKLLTFINNYIASNDNAIIQIIQEVDKYFSNKKVSVKKQEEIIRLINNHITIKDIDKKTDSRSRLTWYTKLIKNANNHGESQLANNYLTKYNKLKKEVIENDRELVANSDLNITVFFNDSFDFESAKMFAENQKSDPSYRYLSLLTRSKISSSYAQTLSLIHNYQKAEEIYSEAIDYLKASDTKDQEKNNNLTKILTYRIINAFDGNLSNKNKIFNELFKNPQEAYNNLKNNKLTEPYLIYALLRIAYFHSDFRFYYKGLPNEEDINSTLYHPWELIYLYDALLSNDKTKTHKLNKSISICNQDNQGSTMKFIGYTINMISELLGVKVININSENIKEYLNENLTPALEYFNKILEIKGSNKPKDKKIHMILEGLPFYYH